jgi:hypothetical protein
VVCFDTSTNNDRAPGRVVWMFVRLVLGSEGRVDGKSAITALKEETDVAQYWNKMSDSGEAKKLGARTENDRREDIKNDQTVPQPKESCSAGQGGTAQPDRPKPDDDGPKNAACPPVPDPTTLSTCYLRNQEPKPEPEPETRTASGSLQKRACG